MNVIRYDCKSNEEWRKERANSIGASAVGTLIGENPYTTPMQLCQRMRDELAGNFDYTQNLAMMRGHAYEDGVAKLFNWQTGHQVIKSSSAEYLLRRDDIPFMHASPDRTYWIDENGKKHGKNAEANKGILECKTTMRPIDPENLPLSWVFQLQVQMGISGYHQGFIAWDVLSSHDGFGFQYFDFNQEVFDAAVEVCRDFWTNCIIGGKDPDPVSASDIISRYPRSISGKTVTASQDIQVKIDTIKNMKGLKKELESEIEALSDDVKAVFTDAETLIDLDGNVLATYKNKEGAMRVDSKKLKSDYPDVYYEVAKQGEPSRTLLIK